MFRILHSCLFESLERRQLLAADFGFNGVSPSYAGILPVGVEQTVTYRVRNAGTTPVTSSFRVQFRMIPIGGAPAEQLPDFYSPAAVDLATIVVDQDLAIGGLGADVVSKLNIPSNLPPGRWALMAFLDSINAFPEANESDNYISWGAARVIPADGVVVIEGTAAKDVMAVGSETGALFEVNINGVRETLSAVGGVKGFDLRGLGGDDFIQFQQNVPGAKGDGGDGNDKVIGGNGNDFLAGGAGKDQLYGGNGNDRLNGNGGNDKLLGEAGADRLYGYAGNDYLDGGSSSDRLEGGLGTDIMLGQGGKDRFFARDTQIDQLFGGSGDDWADRDVADVISSIETNVT